MEIKKGLSLVLALIMVCAMVFSASAEATDPQASLMEVYDGIAPLEQSTTLRYAGGVGNQLVIPMYIAWKLGAFDKAGITLDYHVSQTGPLSVEALAAGEVDFAGSGIGGIAIGAATGKAKMLCYNSDDAAVQMFFVKKDHPLASAALDPATGVRGTAEDWKNVEVYMPAGTTLQFLMGKAMEKLGLSLSDLKVVNMEAFNCMTALLAGTGDVCGIWNFNCYSSKLADYVPIMTGTEVGINLVTAYFTNDAAWNDPVKRAAIEKALELHFATLEWMRASDDNMHLAAKLAAEWGDEEALGISEDEFYRYLKDTTFYSLEDNQKMFTEMVTNDYGEMSVALDTLMGVMDFYVSQGNYAETDRSFMIEHQKDLFPSEGIEDIIAK